MMDLDFETVKKLFEWSRDLSEIIANDYAKQAVNANNFAKLDKLSKFLSFDMNTDKVEYYTEKDPNDSTIVRSPGAVTIYVEAGLGAENELDAVRNFAKNYKVKTVEEPTSIPNGKKFVAITNQFGLLFRHCLSTGIIKVRSYKDPTIFGTYDPSLEINARWQWEKYTLFNSFFEDTRIQRDTVFIISLSKGLTDDNLQLIGHAKDLVFARHRVSDYLILNAKHQKNKTLRPKDGGVWRESLGMRTFHMLLEETEEINSPQEGEAAYKWVLSDMAFIAQEVPILGFKV
jgi:hypothetical protein